MSQRTVIGCDGGRLRGCLDLQQAHEALRRQWPGRLASDAAWLAHHERAAGLYAHVARVDVDHHHEALFWAAQERESARRLVDKTRDRQEV